MSEELLSGRRRAGGPRVLVSAGGTREPLDAVRFLGNRSSGRMGVAVAAEAAARRGRDAAGGQRRRAGSRRGRASSRRRPPPTSSARRSPGADADVIVMAAAVADYRPAERAARQAREGRRPVDASSSCRRSTSLARLGDARTNGQVLVGFAAEIGADGLERERAKLDGKNADLVVFNDVGRSGHRLRRGRTTRWCSSCRDGERHVAEGAEAPRSRGGPGRGRATARGRAVMERPAVAPRAGAPRRSRSRRPRRRQPRSRRQAPRETLRLPVLCLLGEGHVLVEDFPGVGKTMLAKSLARSLDSELLADPVHARPAAVRRDRRQRLRPAERRSSRSGPGPSSRTSCLVDEVNRASPKTQSALLEAMQETQVTIDGVTHGLGGPFLVVATQNPIEYEGTYPLPEAQLDRFAMRMSLGYPPLAEEARMLAEQTTDPPLDDLRPVAGRDERPRRDRGRPRGVRRGERQPLRRGRCSGTRARAHAWRSARALGRASPSCGSRRRARSPSAATTSLPDDVQAIAEAVLAHRVILAPEARSGGVTPAGAVGEALARHAGAGVTLQPTRGVLALGAGALAGSWLFGSLRTGARSGSGWPPPPSPRALWASGRGAASASSGGRRQLRRTSRGPTSGSATASSATHAYRSARRTCASGSASSAMRETRLRRGRGELLLRSVRVAATRFEEAAVVLQDPLGLERVSLPVPGGQPVLVVPQIAELDEALLGERPPQRLRAAAPAPPSERIRPPLGARVRGGRVAAGCTGRRPRGGGS